MVVDVLFMTGLISLLLCILVILVWLHCFNYVDSEEEERKLRIVIFQNIHIVFLKIILVALSSSINLHCSFTEVRYKNANCKVSNPSLSATI